MPSTHAEADLAHAGTEYDDAETLLNILKVSFRLNAASPIGHTR